MKGISKKIMPIDFWLSLIAAGCSILNVVLIAVYLLLHA